MGNLRKVIHNPSSSQLERKCYKVKGFRYRSRKRLVTAMIRFYETLSGKLTNTSER